MDFLIKKAKQKLFYLKFTTHNLLNFTPSDIIIHFKLNTQEMILVEDLLVSSAIKSMRPVAKNRKKQILQIYAVHFIVEFCLLK